MGRQELQVWPQNAISTKKKGVHFHIIIIFKMGFFFYKKTPKKNNQTNQVWSEFFIFYVSCSEFLLRAASIVQISN